MDALGIERAPVAGWSMGSFIAQTLAVSASERVEAILLSSDPGGELSTSTTREHFLRLTTRSGTPREKASRLISLLFPDPPVERDRRAVRRACGGGPRGGARPGGAGGAGGADGALAPGFRAPSGWAAISDAGARRARLRGRRHPGRQLGDDRGPDPGRLEGDLPRRRPRRDGDGAGPAGSADRRRSSAAEPPGAGDWE